MNKKLIALLLSACTAGIIQIHAQTDTSTTTTTSTTTAAPTPPPAPVTAAAAAPAVAPTPPPAPPAWAFSISPEYVNDYMFRGSRLGQDSIQGAIDCTYGNWDLGIWASNPIGQDFVHGQSEPEVDPYGSYKYALNDNWSVQPGFTLYTYTKAPTNEGYFHATFEPNVAINYTVGNLTLTPKFYYDVVLRAPTEEFDAAYTVPLKDLGTELDFSGTIGTYYQYNAVNHSVPKTHAWGDYYLIGVSVPYNLTKDVKLAVGYAYTAGFDARIKQQGYYNIANPEALGKGVVSVTLTYSW